MEKMTQITPVAYFRSPFTSKFGIPRQSGILDELEGKIVFTPELPKRKQCVDWKDSDIFG